MMLQESLIQIVIWFKPLSLSIDIYSAHPNFVLVSTEEIFVHFPYLYLFLSYKIIIEISY